MPRTIKHATLSGAAANPRALVDGPKWDADHLITDTANSVIANYAVQSTDVNSVVQAGTGSTGLFTVTLPAASATGFSEGHTVTVANGDTGRAKLLSGFPSDAPPLLWPKQAIQVKIVNGSWATVVHPGKWNAPSNVTLYVDHANGSDTTGDGLAPSGAGCFATIYHAFQVGQMYLNIGPSGAFTIQVVDTSFTETPPRALFGPGPNGGTNGGLVNIVGNESSPSSCVWNSDGIIVDDGAVISLRGFKTATVSSGKNWVTVDKMGLLVHANMNWGTNTGGAHIAIQSGGVCVFDPGTYTVSGNMRTHVTNNGGTYQCSGATISVPNALTFTYWLELLASGANCSISTTTFTGTGAAGGSTGTQYFAAVGSLSLNGVTLPGATAGVFQSNGVVDGNVAPPVTTSTANSNTQGSITNSGTGSSAASSWEINNGTSFGVLQQNGVNKSFGAASNGEGLIYQTSAGQTIMVDNASGILKIATGGTAEKARFSASGGLSVGTTSDAGAGNVKATSFIGAGTSLTGTAAGLTAGNVTTNANLTGLVTSVGNATSLALGQITNSLSGDTSLNNTGTFFDGPSVAQGSTGTWFASGTVSVSDTAGGAQFFCKLWDGTTIIASAAVSTSGANVIAPVCLSGYLASPAGNLRISVKDVTAVTGKILSSTAGTNSSTISAFRIA